jgi:hypothetical protein
MNYKMPTAGGYVSGFPKYHKCSLDHAREPLEPLALGVVRRRGSHWPSLATWLSPTVPRAQAESSVRLSAPLLSPPSAMASASSSECPPLVGSVREAVAAYWRQIARRDRAPAYPVRPVEGGVVGEEEAHEEQMEKYRVYHKRRAASWDKVIQKRRRAAEAAALAARSQYGA